MKRVGLGLRRWTVAFSVAISATALGFLGEVGATALDAPLPADAVAFIPPAIYRVWWARTEACSQLHGRLGSIRWYSLPNKATFMTPAGERVATWSHGGAGTRIVVAGGYLTDELVVRHEMLHALLDRGSHPPAHFIDRCHLTWQSWGG